MSPARPPEGAVGSSDFLMPSLGADMEAGTVVQWHVREGDRVKPGDVVCVVETHKGAIDVECFLDGVIADLAPLGREMRVGELLAHVVGGAAPAAEASPPAAPHQAAAPAPAPAPEAGLPAAAATPAAAPTVAPAIAAIGAIGTPTGLRAKASPAARRLAAQLGIAIDGLTGHGVDGAVTMADVRAAAAGGQAAPREAPAAPAAGPAGAARPVARGFDPALMRQAIAAAMARSKREIPHYYLASTIDFGAAAGWVERYNADRDPAERLLPAVLLLKAAARGLAEVPQLNGRWENDGFRAGAGIHLGWAVALRGGGLIAPAIHDADRQPLPALMLALRDLVQRARGGGLRSSEMSDATATVTSLGDRGADNVFGVIVPPQVALIGFGRVVQRPWVVAGELAVRPLVQISLAADHRASDGHLGGRLLAAIDAALQDPERLAEEDSR